MWNPFKKKSLLSEENESFQIETFKWLLRNFGGKSFLQHAQLILPTEEFFPVEANKETEKVARHIFKLIKKYSGLGDWPCILEAQETDANHRIADTVVLQNMEHNPLGTFSSNELNEVIITYNPKLTSSPTQMVATLSHELSHYLTSTAKEPPPGGWDNWEFATDITATFLGFGIFQANSAFSFQQYTEIGTQGWQASRNGYLSEAEHSYALALFLKLKGIPIEKALPFCDTNIKSYLKKAFKEIEKTDIIEMLQKVKYFGSEANNNLSSKDGFQLPKALKKKLSLPLQGNLYILEMLNDDDTPMDYVVDALTMCFNQTPAKAEETMMKIHNDGSADVLTGNEITLKDVAQYIEDMPRNTNIHLVLRSPRKTGIKIR